MRSRISQTPRNKKDGAHRDVLFVEGIPATTKRPFKRACAGRESMRDAVIKLMRYYVRVNGVIPEPKR